MKVKIEPNGMIPVKIADDGRNYDVRLYNEGGKIYILSGNSHFSGNLCNDNHGYPYSYETLLNPEFNSETIIYTIVSVNKISVDKISSVVCDADKYVIENTDGTKKTFEILTKLISDNYSSSSIYSEIRSYHNSHNNSFVMNSPKKKSSHLFGIELEVVGKSVNDYFDLVNLKSNWFFKENDSSLPSQGIEFITIPLLPEDARKVSFWKNLCKFLIEKATSWENSQCGLHIHISKTIFGEDKEIVSENQSKIWFLYNYYLKNENFNVGINGRSRCYNEHDMSTGIGDSVKALGNEVLSLKSTTDKLKESCLDKGSEGRYFDINIQNEKTIEFRKGKGSINPVRIAALCRYYEGMCLFCAKTSWKNINKDNFLKFISRKESKSSPVWNYISKYEE